MPTYDILLWALSAVLMAIGVAGAVLPVLPGAAARVGVATGLGLLLAMVAKVVIAFVFVMVGVFVVALIV